MPWTALHAALGLSGGDLTFDMIKRACEDQIEESSALDWKRQLPLTALEGEAKFRQQAELAKDVAAMANSGGGLIVFGMAEVEDPASSAADHVEPVGVVAEVQLQQIRQVAGALIFPPVVGLDLLRVAPQENPSDGVLALVVPESVAVPHLVHPRDSNKYEYFMAPYRHGPHTERMVEQQLALAYRNRDTAASTRRRDFEETWASALRSLDDGRIWQVAIAMPETPPPRPREFTQRDAHGIFDMAARRSRPGAVGCFDMIDSSPTRRGLQRFIRAGQMPLNTGRSTVAAKARAELHNDGTIIVATTRSGAFPGGSATGGDQEVAVSDLEQIGTDLIRVLITAQRQRGWRANYATRIGISRPTQIFRHPDDHLLGDVRPFDEADRILDFQPVDGPILGLNEDRDTITTAFDLIEDVVNQTGDMLWADPTTFQV